MFSNTLGVTALLGKKIVIIGCGAQGLNQGLNMRDSGLDISYALRKEAISQKRDSYVNATSNDFVVGDPNILKGYSVNGIEAAVNAVLCINLTHNIHSCPDLKLQGT